MAGTYHSTRLAAGASSSPNGEEKSSPQAGTKRKAEVTDFPAGKRGRKGQRQQTLEETFENGDADSKDESDKPFDIEMKDAATEGVGTDKAVPPADSGARTKSDKIEGIAKDEAAAEDEASAEDEAAEYGAGEDEKLEMVNKADDAEAATKSTKNGTHSNGDANSDDTETAAKDVSKKVTEDDGGIIDHASDREGSMPANVLEKGIIYFLTRGRVGIEDPDSIQDLQRTYFILRPIPKGSKIGAGAIEDGKGARLIALPKKVFPKSGRDRFMVFVEKSGVSMKELKEDFFQGSEYTTKTTGVRQTPPVAPLGEGVYALTVTGNTSHLAYMLTIPKDLSEVQEDIGLREKGSFVTSLKNPTVSGPSYASLPEKPDFPEGFIEDFGGRSWMPIQKSEYLNYPNAQLLLIGEGEEKFANALEPTEKDQKHDKDTPQEELEKLENEDQIRVEHLRGDDSVFSDLGISKKEYPDVMTTW